jgi:hypothetical protein
MINNFHLYWSCSISSDRLAHVLIDQTIRYLLTMERSKEIFESTAIISLMLGNLTFLELLLHLWIKSNLLIGFRDQKAVNDWVECRSSSIRSGRQKLNFACFPLILNGSTIVTNKRVEICLCDQSYQKLKISIWFDVISAERKEKSLNSCYYHFVLNDHNQVHEVTMRQSVSIRSHMFLFWLSVDIDQYPRGTWELSSESSIISQQIWSRSLVHCDSLLQFSGLR